MVPLTVRYVITSPLSLARLVARDPRCAGTRRGGPMPDVLDRTDDDRWHDPDFAEVSRLVQEHTGAASEELQPWQLPRVAGRYAPVR